MYFLIPFLYWNYVQEVNTFGKAQTPKKKQKKNTLYFKLYSPNPDS